MWRKTVECVAVYGSFGVVGPVLFAYGSDMIAEKQGRVMGETLRERYLVPPSPFRMDMRWVHDLKLRIKESDSMKDDLRKIYGDGILSYLEDKNPTKKGVKRNMIWKYLLNPLEMRGNRRKASGLDDFCCTFEDDLRIVTQGSLKHFIPHFHKAIDKDHIAYHVLSELSSLDRTLLYKLELKEDFDAHLFLTLMGCAARPVKDVSQAEFWVTFIYLLREQPQYSWYVMSWLEKRLEPGERRLPVTSTLLMTLIRDYASSFKSSRPLSIVMYLAGILDEYKKDSCKELEEMYKSLDLSLHDQYEGNVKVVTYTPLQRFQLEVLLLFVLRIVSEGYPMTYGDRARLLHLFNFLAIPKVGTLDHDLYLFFVSVLGGMATTRKELEDMLRRIGARREEGGTPGIEFVRRVLIDGNIPRWTDEVKNGKMYWKKLDGFPNDVKKLIDEWEVNTLPKKERKEESGDSDSDSESDSESDSDGEEKEKGNTALVYCWDVLREFVQLRPNTNEK